jgi:Zn-dependent protease
MKVKWAGRKRKLRRKWNCHLPGRAPTLTFIPPMLGWSMNLFRVRGIQLAVHFSFFLLLAYAAWLGWMGDPEQPGFDRWVGMAWHVATLLAFFTCVVLHEFGHSFTAMHYGVGVRRILLMPIGGMAEFDAIPRQPARELLITLAGPAVNFAIAGVLWLVVGVPEGWPGSPPGNIDFAANAEGFGQLVLTWNILMGVFNLVPVFPMDGGRIFRALLATRIRYLRATLIAATVGKLLAGVAAAILLYYHHPLTAALFMFIFFAGEMEYRAVRQRELDDAHWRAVLTRLYGPSSPEEPPMAVR